MEKPTFNQLLSRADDETLQHLVGRHAVRLLNVLDPRLATPAYLRKMCLQLQSPEALLTDPESRFRLLTLLRPEHAVALAESLGLDVDRSYDVLQTVKIRKNSVRQQKLFSFFGIISSDPEDSAKQGALEKTLSHYGLFDHQRAAQRAVLDALQSDERRVLLHMPTGAGKTRTALHIVASELRRREPTVIMWLAYSEELCDQAATEFESAWSYLGDRTVNIYRFWGPDRNLDIGDINDGFMVAGLSKTYERARRDVDFIARLADRVTLVIIDEAHQAIAETYRFLLEFLIVRNEETALLGLTATPGRSWDDPSVDEELSQFFGRKKITLQVPGYDSSVNYLIDQGYLARPVFKQLLYKHGEHLDDRKMNLLASSLDIPEGILRQLAEDEHRNLIIVNAVEAFVRQHTRILVFAATVDHAKLLAVVLQARGIDASAVTGVTPRDERSRVIHRYKNNDPIPRVLCNYGVLTTGFDAPRTSAAIIARPTKSLVLYSQMVGRATRGPRAGGNKEAEIATVVDTNLPGFGDMATAFGNWEDVWDD